MSSYRSRPPSRYGKVGLKCLVRLAGYYTDGQWQYLQEVKNIPRIALLPSRSADVSES